MQINLDLGLQRLSEEIRGRLLRIYGPQREVWRPDPMTQFVAAMVSYRERDEVSIRAFRRLQEYCAGDWEMLIDMRAIDIQEIIFDVNLADVKATALPIALRQIRARSGSVNLDFLAAWEDEAAMQWLDMLWNVGAKIAATVLNFSNLRKRTLSVDTHLLRVGERLRIVGPHPDFESGFEAYMNVMPDSWDADDLYEFHWLMKRHGQEICTHANPRCELCPLNDLCPSMGVVESVAPTSIRAEVAYEA